MSIRIATEADIPAMLEIYRPYVENTTYSFEYDLPCRREFTQRFLHHTEQFPWLVWEEEGQVLGYAYASAPWERAAYRWCAGISIYLSPQIHRRGIGRALYGRIEELLARQGYRLVYAVVTSENRASLDFHKRLGYTVRAEFPGCGFKQGQWVGTVWLEKALCAPRTPDSFPKSWHSFL